MTNYFYTDANGQKQGLIDEQQLKTLTAHGTIGPHTPLETEAGQQIVAGQIPGLFAAVAPPPTSKQLYCTNCGNSVSEQAVACMSCGTKPVGHRKFCRQCGTGVSPEQVICTKCGSGISGETVATATQTTSQASFCTNCGHSVSKQAVACMSCGAEPAKYRKYCYGCGTALNPEQVVCVRCGVPVGNNATISRSKPVSKSKFLDTYFMVYWICMVIGYPLLFAAGIGIPVFVTGIVFACMLLYQAWKTIPGDMARTTPEKAVGYCFIPFFNLYWVFVAFKGLGEDMNEALRQRGIQFEVNVGLGLRYCILSVVCACVGPVFCFLGGFLWADNYAMGELFVYVGMGSSILCSIAAIVLCIFFLKSVKDGTVALLGREEA